MSEKIAVQAEKGNARKIKNDIIFVLVLLLVIAMIGLVMLLTREEGTIVEVTVGGELYGIFSLNEEQRVEIITGEDGEYINILVIKDGKAYVESANCPRQDCVLHRPISFTGESILCKNHKVAIIINSEDEPQIDIVS